MGFQLEVLSWPNSSMIPTMWPQVRNPALEKRTRTWEPYLDLSRSKCNRWEDGEGKQAFSVLIEPDTMETEIFCCLNSGSLHSGILGQGQGGRAFLCDWAGEKRKRDFFFTRILPPSGMNSSHKPCRAQWQLYSINPAQSPLWGSVEAERYYYQVCMIF